MNGKESLTSDLKAAVFTMAMANGDESTFDQLLAVREGGRERWEGGREGVCVCVREGVCVCAYVNE